MDLIINKSTGENNVLSKYSLVPRIRNNLSDFEIPIPRPVVRETNVLSIQEYNKTFNIYLDRMFTSLLQRVLSIQLEKHELHFDKNKLYNEFAKVVYHNSSNSCKSYHFLK